MPERSQSSQSSSQSWPEIEHRWRIWVCKHGYRVEWLKGAQLWLHKDADGRLCDDTDVIEVTPQGLRDRG